ncbi:hypothetical protein HD806DRAFT_92563 [Xylariaceae sp. AK1471]|nr:hypothetical protein HD806DRAFT_92563 [Xylariaceae sp. AK1471]
MYSTCPFVSARSQASLVPSLQRMTVLYLLRPPRSNTPALLLVHRYWVCTCTRYRLHCGHAVHVLVGTTYTRAQEALAQLEPITSFLVAVPTYLVPTVCCTWLHTAVSNTCLALLVKLLGFSWITFLYFSFFDTTLFACTCQPTYLHAPTLEHHHHNSISPPSKSCLYEVVLATTTAIIIRLL